MRQEFDVVAMLTAAREHQSAKRWHESEVLLRRILTDDSNCAEAWWRLGLIGMEAKQYSIAQQYALRAIELQPASADGYYCSGLNCEAQSDWRDAEQNFRRAVELDSNLGDAQKRLGECLLKQRRAAEALACFERALRSGPDWGDIQLLRAIPRPGKVRLKQTVQSLVKLYEAAGQDDKAAQWKETAAEIEVQDRPVDATKGGPSESTRDSP